MQPKVPVTPPPTQLSVLPLAAGSLALSAREDSPAIRAECENSIRPALPQSVWEKDLSLSCLFRRKQMKSQMKSQTLYGIDTGEDFSFQDCSAAWLLNEFAAIFFVGP